MKGRALLILFALPLLLCAAVIFSPFTTNPVALWGGIGIGYRPGWLPGYGTIDPAAGLISFPLGVRAAIDVLSGALPFWNHYEGLGTPLLGEMQSAALFPPTLLLSLPHGQLIEHFALQALAGLGAYLFLRRFGVGTQAALAGALLYEFNGVFAWLRNAIFNPVAFLPWLLYAVESLFHATTAGQQLGQRLQAICLGAFMAAMALYSGFPEEVYFYTIFI